MVNVMVATYPSKREPCVQGPRAERKQRAFSYLQDRGVADTQRWRDRR